MENFRNKCLSCAFRRGVPGSAHSSCRKKNVIINASSHGIKMGWFMFPFDFDPNWLEYCSSFMDKGTKIESLEKEDIVNLIYKEMTIIKTLNEAKRVPLSIQKALLDKNIFKRVDDFLEDKISLEESRELAKDMLYI